jgi:uncharacterized protein (DUF1330 family)
MDFRRKLSVEADKTDRFMKPVYVVNSYDIHDFETYSGYPERVRPLLAAYGAKVIAMDAHARVLEGKTRTMNAVIEFPSEEAVHKFYNDPNYQSFIHLRQHSTSNTSMIIIDKFG